MKTRFLILTVCAFLFALASCQKENINNIANSNEIIEMSAKTVAVPSHKYYDPKDVCTTISQQYASGDNYWVQLLDGKFYTGSGIAHYEDATWAITDLRRGTVQIQTGSEVLIPRSLAFDIDLSIPFTSDPQKYISPNTDIQFSFSAANRKFDEPIRSLNFPSPIIIGPSQQAQNFLLVSAYQPGANGGTVEGEPEFTGLIILDEICEAADVKSCKPVDTNCEENNIVNVCECEFPGDAPGDYLKRCLCIRKLLPYYNCNFPN